jgi:isoamylase
MDHWPGAPQPQGARWDGHGTNFAVYSEAAAGVRLCLLEPDGAETAVDLDETTGFVWHGYLPGVGPGQRYGYRVDGRFAPDYGCFCAPGTLLLDPYARAIDDAFRSVVVDAAFDWRGDVPPAVPRHETVVYETHVKGLTKLHPEVEPELRGTYAGLAHPAVVEHLRSLGVTAVELLPVQQFVHRRSLLERGLRNYWGYDPIGYFAPHREYSAAGEPVTEFKAMVRDLHAAGLEVILDVVYNHTGEGGHPDPALCFRGIDNQTYYLHWEEPEPPHRVHPVDYSGCGNTLNFAHPQVLRLILDSLRYWAGELHVDGFRFDLASAIGRDVQERNALDLDTGDWTETFFDRRAAFFDAVAQDPLLERVKLIAEPWDVTWEGYQLGNYPPQWTEWNGRYRDTVRDYWRSAEGTVPELATRVSGSADLFADDGRQPYASVNFVTAHDGFTLADLVAYGHKHNEANGEENRDGADANRSWNCGAEGPTDDPAIRSLRARQQRNLLTTLALSQGLPMVLGGDELGRTQQGNNNAYCQDNELSWTDWSLDDERRELLAFARRALGLRRAHPVFRRRRWLTGTETLGSGARDVVWLTPAGTELTAADWANPLTRALGIFLNGDEITGRAPDGSRVRDARFLVLANAWWEPLDFTLPGEPLGARWALALDTADPAAAAGSRDYGAGAAAAVAGRALVVLERAG